MHAKSLTHRQIATLSPAVVERVLRRETQPTEKSPRRAGKASRGGRQGARLAIRKAAGV